MAGLLLGPLETHAIACQGRKVVAKDTCFDI